MKIFLLLFLYTSQIWTLAIANSLNSRIIGGEPSNAGEFPYAAAIYKTTADGTYFCTGSILNTEWIITAGQCVDGATMFTILIGTHKLNGDEATAQRLATSEYVVHPEYNPTTLVNDIGLIKFRSPITYTNYIRNIHLPYSELGHHATGTAYGWGQTTDSDSQLSNTLQSVNLTGVSTEQCQMTYGGQISETMTCFEGNYNEGTCFGDSGSPIIYVASRGYVIVIAIASFFSANGCESTDPSGYTKVFPYNDWVNSVIKNQV